MVGFTVKTTVDNFKQVRVIPQAQSYKVEIVYEKEVKQRETNKSRIMGIDLGVTNIMTIANNIGLPPIIIKDNGQSIKSINQFYSKEKAKLQSIYDLQKVKSGKKMLILKDKHKRKEADCAHKMSRFVIDYAIQNDIGKIIIGYNPEWKQKVNLGRKTNQLFSQIPYATLIHQVSYKGEEASIEVALQEESHTSKCSFLDNEPIKHHEVYAGKRISRGLFRSKQRIIINADVQAGYNIIKKSEPKAFTQVNVDGVGGCGLHPLSVFGTDKQDLLKYAKVA